MSYQVTHQSVLHFLKNKSQHAFDIIFLDPPYALNLLSTCLSLLAEWGWCHEQTRIYFEHEAQPSHVPMLPEQWRILHSKTAGKVQYTLAQASSHADL
jgi:16S rRNA (guanine966-N2)-methyltransferase